MKLRLAVPTRSYPTPLKTTLQTISGLKVEGVQFDVRNELRPDELGATGLRQFRKQMEELNLKVGSCAFPLRKPIADEQLLDQRIDALKKGMKFTFELGASVLTVRTGRLPDPKTEAAHWNRLCEILDELAAYGNHVGTTLCLGVSFESPERLKQLLQSIDGPLGLNFDPVHVYASGHSVSETFRGFHDRIHHVRARDGIRTIDDEVEETPIGLGEIDWEELIATLHEADYRDWITFDRISGENRPRDLARGVQVVRQLLPH